MAKSTQRESFLNPFTLVIFLTLSCIFLSVKFLSDQPNTNLFSSLNETMTYWREGFFGLLGFTLQMIMILVFGYCLAIYRPVHSFLLRVSKFPTTKSQAVLFVLLISVCCSLANWGFGLIVGALLARFVSEAMSKKRIPIDPALLAASSYAGMAVWHGGLSGSAPLKVAEKGHFLEESIGVISIDQTIFTGFNFLVTSLLVLVFAITLILILRFYKAQNLTIKPKQLQPIEAGKGFPVGILVGLFMLLCVISGYFWSSQDASFFDLNLVNFILFALVLLAYRTLPKFTASVKEGLKNSADILIQFPFYAGILGILTSSGLLSSFSTWVLQNSSEASFAPLTLIAAASVNFLVPSGGGQWAVQGPILMDVSQTMGFDLGKMVMVFSFGDQISNLLQPFWALPLLAITGVRAKHVFKYSVWMFVTGFSLLLILLTVLL
ncbi:TIGR00366 family protein [Algoriphagus sediminis]|uniref:TIGR00366 family protein n=1 Tax=Algoriphagus sediminis TaxID=3057113 RepID=A0ABT7Y8M3_9BACT|nr:TIGR00366 family protein [Algoriphagus sediminis]MDN3202589.1 TIGR00366 family protein [Algoriphagus sediminis]